MNERYELYEKQIEKLIEQKQFQTDRFERIRKCLERKEAFLYNYGKDHFKLDWTAFKKLQDKYEKNMIMKRWNISPPIHSTQVSQPASVFDSPQSFLESKISVNKIAKHDKTSTPKMTQIEHDEQKMIEILEDFEVRYQYLKQLILFFRFKLFSLYRKTC